MAPAHDPEATRTRILDAAEADFAGRGYHGARVDAIAQAAAVNKRMLYHYFADKAGLYAATLERLLQRIFAKMEPAFADAERLDAVAAVTTLLERFFDVSYEEPNYVNIFVHAAEDWRTQAMENESYPRVIGNAMATLVTRTVPILQRGAREGVLRSDLDPTLVGVLAVLLCRTYLLVLRPLDVFHPAELSDPEGLAFARRHIVSLFVDGLRTREPAAVATSTDVGQPADCVDPPSSQGTD